MSRKLLVENGIERGTRNMERFAGLMGFVFFLGVFFFSASVQATDFEANNKVGIHISSFSDENARDACELVNSNGGKWGYATLVLQTNDLNRDKWQHIFDMFRECGVIPIIRIATEPDGENWRSITEVEIERIGSFLNSLNWVTKDRLVTFLNEPNHCRETGGTCNPEKYAKDFVSFSQKLHRLNPDFVVGMAGLDQIAPSGPDTMTEETYLRRMFAAEPQTSNYIDAVFSHSYPNPHFTGSVFAAGRGSIRGYEWELALLRGLGVTKNVPVYITETGWDQSRIGTERVADNFKNAYEKIWLPDSRVRAVTPFDLHIGPPFCHFSWKHCDTGAFNGNFSAVSSLSKQAGNPPQRHRAQVVTTLARELVEGSIYNFQVWFKNEGQSICDAREGFELKIINATFDYTFSDCYSVRPGASWVSNFEFKPGAALGNHRVRIGLFKDGRLVLPLFDWDIEVLAKPSSAIRVKSIPEISPTGENFKLLIYDKNQQVVFKRENVKVIEGAGEIAGIDNIALDECYRVVLVRDSFLPVQRECVRFAKTGNSIDFPVMLRIDRNKDGKFSFADLF